MNLGPPISNSGSQRPYQAGHASGIKVGKPIRVAVEWMVDTGADIGVVRKTVGDNFDLVVTAGSASSTTGGGGILIKTGEDVAGASHPMTSILPVGVKSNDAGSDILGMEQLGSLGVEVIWKPDVRAGTLMIRAFTASTTTPAHIPATKSIPPSGITDHGTWLDVGAVRIEKRHWTRS